MSLLGDMTKSQAGGAEVDQPARRSRGRWKFYWTHCAGKQRTHTVDSSFFLSYILSFPFIFHLSFFRFDTQSLLCFSLLVHCSLDVGCKLASPLSRLVHFCWKSMGDKFVRVCARVCVFAAGERICCVCFFFTFFLSDCPSHIISCHNDSSHIMRQLHPRERLQTAVCKLMGPRPLTEQNALFWGFSADLSMQFVVH